MPAVMIRSTSGATYTLGDVRWEVREEIEEAMIRDEMSGEVSVGGQIYTWRVID